MRRLLVLSCFLNVLLAALVVYGLHARGNRNQAVAPPEGDFPAEAAFTGAGTELQTNFASPGPRIRSWRDIESTDYRQYIANLKSIGCPEATIAEIIISEVNTLYRTRLAQLPSAKRPEYKFWVTRGDWLTWLQPKLDAQTQKARLELELEKRELLRELLGPAYASYDFPDKDALRWENDPFFAALPSQKRGQVFGVTRHYDTLADALREHRQSFFDEDDRKGLGRLQTEKEQAIAGILTPAELEEFEIRFSTTAEMLRKSVPPGFDATEAEFRAIFAAQKEIRRLSADEQLAAPEMAGEKAAKLKQIEDSLKTSLGEDRYKQAAGLLRR